MDEKLGHFQLPPESNANNEGETALPSLTF
jgi:hypothetical protein